MTLTDGSALASSRKHAVSLSFVEGIALGHYFCILVSHPLPHTFLRPISLAVIVYFIDLTLCACQCC